MARASLTDPLHSMRFLVRIAQGDDKFSPNAGFSTCSIPELTVEATEYREGHYVYTRKFPGLPTLSDLTFGRGVTLGDNDFYNWMLQSVEGGEYRADLKIYQLHRSVLPGPGGDVNPQNINMNEIVAKVYNVFNAFPIRCKVAGDLDATSAEISVAELDVAYESFTVETVQ